MKHAGVRLVATRCYNHPDREASARCTACGRFHCRECVAEHDGRMICGVCLRKERSTETSARRPWLAISMRVAQGLVAAIVAWTCFYLAGRALLQVPADFHEGTVWKGDWWTDDDQ